MAIARLYANSLIQYCVFCTQPDNLSFMQEEQEYNDKVAEAYNKYMTAELYYTDGDNVIATLSMQSYFEPYDYYYGYEDEEDGYYDYEPVITFVSDESTFSMESYFDDVSFNDLINSAEDLADEYENYLQYLLN